MYMTKIYRSQGSHGHGKSWKILKFETILESHGKVMDFCLFSRSHGKLIFQGKVMEKSWDFTQTVSSVHDVWLWQSCGLHIYTSSLLSFTLSRECIYINVCLVMVVAVRAGQVILKFKFMVIDFNFIQSIQLYRPNL